MIIPSEPAITSVANAHLVLTSLLLKYLRVFKNLIAGVITAADKEPEILSIRPNKLAVGFIFFRKYLAVFSEF